MRSATQIVAAHHPELGEDLARHQGGVRLLPDREVKVRRAVEGVTSGDPAERGVWHVEEGPHGELVYENRWLRPDLRGLRLEKIGFVQLAESD